MDGTSRDALRSRLVELLGGGSVLLYGRRRIGKSTLLDSLAAYPPQSWLCWRIDLEGLRDAPVVQLAEQLERLAPENVVVTGAARVTGVGAGPATLSLAPREPITPWNRVEEALRRLAQAHPGRTLCVGLDEVPWWLDAIEQRGAGEARAALAQLRRLRQAREFATHLRFVLTGSVGLAGQAMELGASAELNDLDSLQVEPLQDAEGAALFEAEVVGSGRHCDRAAAQAAHRLAGGVPHWIKVIATHAGSGAVTPASVEAAAERLLRPEQRSQFADEGHEHFKRRHGARLPALAAILDVHSEVRGGISLQGAITAAQAVDPALTRAQARECVYLLVDGFYLRPTGDETFEWALPLFQRWWQRYGGA